jgi:chromosome segregation ATPase
MLEMIIDKLPTLAKIETTVAALEQKHAQAQGRVQALALKVQQARETDLNGEAAALNSGRKVPKPTEPHLREQLDGAQRDLEVLERRLSLANSDRARHISEHHERILSLLEEAHAEHGEKVSTAASEALTALLAYHAAEDEARNLQRLHPVPALENTGGPESHVTVWGNLTTQNATGGPQRGTLEGTLRYLVSLGAPTVVEGGGEDDLDAA